MRLIALDHFMTITDGDPSDAGMATRLTTEASRVAQETKAAVLVVCHFPKATAGKTEQDQHSVFGSTFIVNNTRGTLLLVGMTPSEAKDFGLPVEQRKHYVQLWIGKANAGPSNMRVCWLEKMVMPLYETVVLNPVDLQSVPNAEKLKAATGRAGNPYRAR